MRNREFVFATKIEYKLVAERSKANQNSLTFPFWCVYFTKSEPISKIGVSESGDSNNEFRHGTASTAPHCRVRQCVSVPAVPHPSSPCTLPILNLFCAVWVFFSVWARVRRETSRIHLVVI